MREKCKKIVYFESFSKIKIESQIYFEKNLQENLIYNIYLYTGKVFTGNILLRNQGNNIPLPHAPIKFVSERGISNFDFLLKVALNF